MKTVIRSKIKAITILSMVLMTTQVLEITADTVLTAPDGKNLCYGQNTIRCKLNPKNSEQEYVCLLMGNWNGVSLIAPVDQTDKDVSNRLYMVALKNSTEANFNFLEQNVIKITGASLSRYLKNDKAFKLWRGQVCQWVNSHLPESNPCKNQLLITSQYDRGYFHVFNIVNANKKNPEYSILEAQFFKEVKIQDPYYVVALDVVDLNVFAKDLPPDKILPKSLMVWAKVDGQTGYDNLQLTAPTMLLVCEYKPESTTLVPDQLVSFPFTRRGKNVTTTKDDDFRNIIGGFITSILPDGRIAYFYSQAEGHVLNWNTYHAASKYWGNLSTNGLPIIVDNNKIKLENASCVCWGRLEHYINDVPNRAAQPLWEDWNEMNPGPSFVVGDDKVVAIVPYVQKHATAKYKDNPEIKRELYKPIGKLEYLPEDIREDITTSIRSDKEPATKEEKLDYLMKNDGVCVYAVMYGWPYFAWQTFISQKDYPKIRQEESSSYLAAEDWGNGVSVDVELGYNWGIKEKSISGKIGSKSQYEFKHNQGGEEKKTVTTTFTVAKDATISTEDYANSGVIFYLRTTPVISSGGNISPMDPYPGKNNTYRVWVKGLEQYSFIIVFASVSVGPEKNGAFTRQCFFNLSNPEKLTIADDFSDDRFLGNTYSPLSKGLSPKPSSLLAFKDQEELQDKFDKVRAFQDNSRFLDLISRATTNKSNPKGMGVYPYLQMDAIPGYDGSVSYDLQKESVIKYNDAQTYKFSDSHSWTEGFTWDYSIPGFYSKGSISYKGSVSFINQKSKTRGFDITVPACLSAGSRSLSLYVFYVDIPKLKNGLYLSGEFKKPFYVPDYCWDNNNSFMLIVPYIPVRTFTQL